MFRNLLAVLIFLGISNDLPLADDHADTGAPGLGRLIPQQT